MNELENLIFTEKYRPKNFDELILENKEKLINYLRNPKMLPSFLFYSSSPGTGKTSCAKLIIKTLNCDALRINSSDERGIDTIREKIKLFARSMSSNDVKRCIFLDEADGLTTIAQDSLRNIMETYSDNCFFILTANDVSKIIEPLKSRCVVFNFENPDEEKILQRLEYICKQENIKYTIEELDELVQSYYPDIRSMILVLQDAKLNNKSITSFKQINLDYLQAIKKHDIKYLYEKVYNGELDIQAFTRWLFRYLFDNYEKFKFSNLQKMAYHLADIEKYVHLGVNKEIVFLSNIIQLINLL